MYANLEDLIDELFDYKWIKDRPRKVYIQVEILKEDAYEN